MEAHYSNTYVMEPPNLKNVSVSKCPDYAVDLVYFREVDCVYKSTFGLSFVGRFVLVLYRRFHYNGTNQEFTFHCCPNFWIPELFEGPTNCSNYSP